MAGEIIEFRLHHELRRGRRHRRQAVPRGPAGQARLDQQIARISGLLGELEELTRNAGASPPPILVRARASILETSRIRPPGKQSAASTGPEESSEVDPQPDIDRGLLEKITAPLIRPSTGPSTGTPAATWARSTAVFRTWSPEP